MVMESLRDIVMGVYGFAVAMNSPIVLPPRDNFQDQVIFIGEIYHEHPQGKIRLIKIVRAATNWNLRQSKGFVEECEKIFLEDINVLKRLNAIIEENQ